MYKFTAIFFLLVFVCGCTEKEFLTEIPHTLSDASFYTSPDGAVQGLNVAYDILQLAVNCGHEANALVWINRVRDRTRNAGMTGYPLPLSYVSKEQVWAERRVELCFEGHQFFDIIRTGRAAQILKNEVMQYETFGITVVYHDGESVTHTLKEQWGENFDLGRDEIWPVPPSEAGFLNIPTA